MHAGARERMLVSMKRANQDREVLMSLCVGAALLFCAAVLGSCARPLPDLSKVQRGWLTRTVTVGGEPCMASLPIVIRADFAEEYLATALAAAQPWAEAVGFAVAVPALPDEQATVGIVIEPCPSQFVKNEAPYCQRFAETARACHNGQLYQEIRLFVPDAATDFYVLMHELGHALGAWGGTEHSTAEWSIMFPTIRAPRLMDGEAGPDASAKTDAPQWVRPEDAASVRRVWGL